MAQASRPDAKGHDMDTTTTPRDRHVLAIATCFPMVGSLIGVAGAMHWLDHQALVACIIALDIALVAWMMARHRVQATPAGQ
jgi:hypothetical protein